MKKQILIFIIFFGLGYIGFKVFFPQSTEEDSNLTLQNGTWTLSKDSYSTLDITENQLIFKYAGEFSNDTGVFNYTLVDGSKEDKGIIIKMYNKTDTLRYEIMGQNDTLLNLLDLNMGRINTYYLKK